MSEQGSRRAKRAVLWLLRKGVELAAVTLGVYALAALAALNVPAFLACVLLENTLLGLWFALECKKAAPVLEHRNGQGGKVCCCYRLHHTRIGGKLQ